MFDDEDLEHTKHAFEKHQLPCEWVERPFQGRTLHALDISGTPLEMVATKDRQSRLDLDGPLHKGAAARGFDHCQITVPDIQKAAEFYTVGERAAGAHQVILEGDEIMSRVPYPTREEFPEAYRPVYDRMVKERGNPTPHIFVALANIPNLLDPLLSFTKEMKQDAAIEQWLRELAIVTVGHKTGCAYEFDHHWNIALGAGLRRGQLEHPR